MTNRSKTGVIVISFLTGCGQAEQDTAFLEADVEAIEYLLREEVAAVESGDIEAQLAIRTADVLEMPPNELPFIGIEAYRTWSSDDPFSYQIKAASMDEIRVTGDWAYSRYSYTWILTPVPGGESVEVSGKGIWIVQRQPDGSWKIAREIWNNDKPLADAQLER
jgi:ketosteroid isomerase-like protein